MSILSVVVIIALATVAVAILALTQFYSGWSKKARLLDLGLPKRLVDRRNRLERLDEAIRQVPFLGSLSRQLKKAGLRIRLAELSVITIIVMVVLWFAVRVIFPVWLSLVVVALVPFVVALWVRYKQKQRLNKFIEQMPLITRTLANSARAGLAIPRGLGLAARDLKEPAHSELGQVTQEMALGASMEESLEALNERMPSREVRVFTTTLVLQQRAGGDLVSAMGDMAQTVESRIDLLQEIRTIMSEPRSGAYAIVILYIVQLYVLEMTARKPDLVERMIANPITATVLAIGTGAIALAIVIMHRLTKID